MATDSINKRKFRAWEQAELFEAMQQALQILERIDEQCGDDKEPEDLPMSLIPTSIIYNIAICYESLYQKVLDDSLLKTGNPKIDRKTLH